MLIGQAVGKNFIKCCSKSRTSCLSCSAINMLSLLLENDKWMQCVNFSDTQKLMDFNSYVITEEKGGIKMEYFPSSTIRLIFAI